MNPIMMHPVLRPSQCSSYSALAGATDASRTQSGFSGKENRKPNHQGYSRVVVPKMPLTPSPSSALHWSQKLSVDFLCATTRKCGVRLLDIKMGKKACLLYPDAPAFNVTPTSTVEFRILWPGYAHLGYTTRITVLHRDGRPATRWDLAREILSAYDAFLERVHHSRYVYDAPTWRVSPSFTSADLKLLSISNYDGHLAVFQADVEIVSRR
ncbi:hypothetical protein C8Q80DRAFT_1268462 [Daedaleopsis nitida]|nr:hypothetical protein C8Q80DRAFT_1268462 [Daedaleopsis nitida]